MDALDKLIECGYEILLILLDGASINTKLVKTTNKMLNPTINNKLEPAARLTRKSVF